MIYVITSKEIDPKTSRTIEIVSHGVDNKTMEMVILPPESPEQIGAVRFEGEWVIREMVEVFQGVPHPLFPSVRVDKLDVLANDAAQAARMEKDATGKGWSVWTRSITSQNRYAFVAYKRSPPHFPHSFADREDGLASCSVCGGGEGSLSHDCPGRRMPVETHEAVYNGMIDYVDGHWIPGRLQRQAFLEAREREYKRLEAQDKAAQHLR